MLGEAYGVRKIIIVCGRTDLRKGIYGLAQLVNTRYSLNLFDKDTLFLFCGNRKDRIKGLLWEGNGFLLLYKRLEDGSFFLVAYPGRGGGDYPGAVPDVDDGAESPPSADP